MGHSNILTKLTKRVTKTYQIFILHGFGYPGLLRIDQATFLPYHADSNLIWTILDSSLDYVLHFWLVPTMVAIANSLSLAADSSWGHKGEDLWTSSDGSVAVTAASTMEGRCKSISYFHMWC